MLDHFAVRIVPASHLTDFAAFDEETGTIEIAADVRPEILPLIVEDAMQLIPHPSHVPIVASVQ